MYGVVFYSCIMNMVVLPLIFLCVNLYSRSFPFWCRLFRNPCTAVALRSLSSTSSRAFPFGISPKSSSIVGAILEDVPPFGGGMSSMSIILCGGSFFSICIN